VILLSIEHIDELISQGQQSIEYILERIKKLDVVTKEDYDRLAHLDDALIELKDTHKSFIAITKSYMKIRRELKK
jgi:hypothetical protein